MNKITYDENCTGWCKDSTVVQMFLERQREYLRMKLNVKGYLYLEEIYDTIGAPWNPDWENICFRKETGIHIDIEPDGNGYYVIEIC